MNDDPKTPHLPDTLTAVAVADVIDAEQWDRLRVTGSLEGGVIDLLDVSECRLVGVVGHGLEGVGLPCGLVGPVAQHPREAQRHAAGIARAGLHSVERDLDDELGPHVHDVAVAGDLQLEQLLCLPSEHLVGESLERLAEHHESISGGVTSPEVEIAQPAATAPVPPLRGEHHEVERAHRLHLQPTRAAAARHVGLIERLQHHALVAAGDRVVEELLRGDRV